MPAAQIDLFCDDHFLFNGPHAIALYSKVVLTVGPCAPVHWPRPRVDLGLLAAAAAAAHHPLLLWLLLLWLVLLAPPLLLQLGLLLLLLKRCR
jgi:hypothetical protein